MKEIILCDVRGGIHSTSLFLCKLVTWYLLSWTWLYRLWLNLSSSDDSTVFLVLDIVIHVLLSRFSPQASFLKLHLCHYRRNACGRSSSVHPDTTYEQLFSLFPFHLALSLKAQNVHSRPLIISHRTLSGIFDDFLLFWTAYLLSLYLRSQIIHEILLSK